MDESNKHTNYLSNRIIIEYPQNMHRVIKNHTNNKKLIESKCVDIPLHISLPWNSISLSLAVEKI